MFSCGILGCSISIDIESVSIEKFFTWLEEEGALLKKGSSLTQIY